MSSQNRNRNNGFSDNKQEVVSITYEEIGLFPRSFSRVLDRFLKQIFSDVENLVIQEYRFYRYLFLTTFKSLCLLFLVPFFVNFLAKNYVIRPLTEYFWNTKQTEIFLNSYQQKRAFAELKDFEEKLYFESLIYPKSAFHSEHISKTDGMAEPVNGLASLRWQSQLEGGNGNSSGTNISKTALDRGEKYDVSGTGTGEIQNSSLVSGISGPGNDGPLGPRTRAVQNKGKTEWGLSTIPAKEQQDGVNSFDGSSATLGSTGTIPFSDPPKGVSPFRAAGKENLLSYPPGVLGNRQGGEAAADGAMPLQDRTATENMVGLGLNEPSANQAGLKPRTTSDEKTESLINSYTLKSSLFVYQTREADKNIQQRYQEKTIELAQRYNDQSIEAITNFFGDVVSLLTLFYLFYALEIQINITKSFLLEVFFGLDDSKKSLLILLVTDLLVGYHSSNLWELFFEFIFNHYGLPESQTGIFLLVATLPVLLDVLFKYLIFRHLNRSSPATVATYHAMIE